MKSSRRNRIGECRMHGTPFLVDRGRSTLVQVRKRRTCTCCCRPYERANA